MTFTQATLSQCACQHMSSPAKEPPKNSDDMTERRDETRRDDEHSVGQPDKRLSMNPQQKHKPQPTDHKASLTLPVEHGKCPPTNLPVWKHSLKTVVFHPCRSIKMTSPAQKAPCSLAVHLGDVVASPHSVASRKYLISLLSVRCSTWCRRA